MRNNPAEWPSTLPLREWQSDAVNTFISHEKPNFLLVATPGAGKTIFALHCAHLLLKSGRIDRVVIVVPTAHLRGQWSKDAHKCGINISASFENGDGRETRDYHGVAITYQTIAAQPDLHRRLVRDSRTMVILDEIHHAGSNLTWGDAINHAFEFAEFQLCMSGTPFRGDNNRIPFVEYDKDSKSRADYGYGYAMALREKVCRTVFFPTFEGEISWLSDDEMRTHSFNDDLVDEEANRRLRAALLAPTWMEDVIREAHGELMRIRDEHPRAGGLVIAMDQGHAKDIAHIIKQATGYEPVVAISEDDDASRHITEFERGSAPWIVAVKMVSEGVDIPRLRVCVYATNVTTALFFRQAIGRIVRRIKDEENPDAFFFIPKDPRLVRHALEVKHERDHEIHEQYEKARQEFTETDEGEGTAPRTAFPFMPYDATAQADGAIHDGYEYEQVLIRRYEKAASDNGISPLRFLAALRDAGLLHQDMAPQAERPTPQPVGPSLDERKARLRDLANTIARQLAGVLSNQTKKPYKECIEYVNRLCLTAKHKTPRQADERQLMSRVEFLRTKLQEARNGSI